MCIFVPERTGMAKHSVKSDIPMLKEWKQDESNARKRYTAVLCAEFEWCLSDFIVMHTYQRYVAFFFNWQLYAVPFRVIYASAFVAAAAAAAAAHSRLLVLIFHLPSRWAYVTWFNQTNSLVSFLTQEHPNSIIITFSQPVTIHCTMYTYAKCNDMCLCIQGVHIKYVYHYFNAMQCNMQKTKQQQQHEIFSFN